MKKHSLKHLPIFFFYIALLIFISCTNNSLSNSLKLNCESNTQQEKTKNCIEPNGNYEVNLPKDWKREFFISENESRLYYADTTRELNKTYISDVGLYQKKTEINQTFLDGKILEITKEPNTHLISSKKILFQEKPGYIIRTSQVDKNRLEIYLQNKNNSFYLIKIDAYGHENQSERFCEALTIIEKSKFY